MKTGFSKVKGVVRGMGQRFLPSDDSCKVPRIHYSLEGREGYMILYCDDNKKSILKRIMLETPDYDRWLREVKRGYKSYY